MNKMKRIVVTGYRGFIGSHLFDALSLTDCEVMGVDKREGTSTTDWETIEKIIKFKPDIIVHLGASVSSQISTKDPLLNFNDNVVGIFNICEAAKILNVPVIFNSSIKVYPGVDGKLTHYGISKQIGEDYLRFYQKNYGVPFVINRPSSVYGPRQNGTDNGGWVTWFIKASLENIPINLYGDGTQSRDIIHVEDHVRLLVDEIFNFDLYKNQDYDFGGGADNRVSLNELLDFLKYHNTKTKKRLFGDIQEVFCDNTKITKVNGWVPLISWKMGVEATIPYYEK